MRQEDKLSDMVSKDLLPESDNIENEERKMGESSPEVVCLLMDLAKERGCATTAETNKTERQSDAEQADNADNNTKICFKTALLNVASTEAVVARVGTGGEKESDDESEVFKECDRRPEEIDVVSHNERWLNIFRRTIVTYILSKSSNVKSI